MSFNLIFEILIFRLTGNHQSLEERGQEVTLCWRDGPSSSFRAFSTVSGLGLFHDSRSSCCIFISLSFETLFFIPIYVESGSSYVLSLLQVPTPSRLLVSFTPNSVSVFQRPR